MDEQNALRFGSEIVFYCDQTKGFMFCSESSATSNIVAIAVNQNVRNPAVGYPDTLIFRICAQNRYKATKNYTKLKATIAKQDVGHSLELVSLQKAAAEEAKVNRIEQARLRGKLLVYGNIIELRHIYTGKYLHINGGRTALLEQNHLRFELMAKNGKSCQLRIVPRFKVKSIGEPVRIEDLVAIESIKVPGQHLHVSPERFDWNSSYENCHELNLSVSPTGFNVFYSRPPEAINQKDVLKGCDYVQLFHRQKEGYLTAEGVYPKVTEAVHLRVRAEDLTETARKTEPPKNGITRWRITKESSIYDASSLRWDERIRLHHLTTRQYLVIESDGKIEMKPELDNASNLFRIFPAIGKKTEPINNKTFIRIQHVQTGYWLSAANEEYERTVVARNTNSLTGNLQYSRCILRKMKATDRMNFDDAFSVIQTPVNIWTVQNRASGYVPFLQKLLDDTLKEVAKWMLNENEDPVKLHQTFLRDFKAVDVVIDILKLNTGSILGMRSQKFIQSVRNDCYSFLHVYLQGKSKKNKLYVARNYDFFTEQLFLGGEDSLNAAFLLMKLLRNNQFLIDLVTEEQISRIISLITIEKNYRYLELLEALCVIQNVGVYNKQKTILEKWLLEPLKEKKDVVYHLSSGHEIGLQPGTIYVSHDNRQNWMPLGDFCKVNDSNSNMFMFLENQLKLFGSLCKGRNKMAIDAITEDFLLLKMEFCYLCLVDENVSSILKSRVCSNITDVFLDVPGNTSMIDHAQLVFQFDAVGKKKQQTGATEVNLLNSATFHTAPISFMKELKAWIREYFGSIQGIVAANTAENRLLEEVLIIVYKLGDFGYYEITDIVELLDPILKIIDGSNGIPFLNASKEAVVEYRNETRFQQSHVNDAVVEAKFRACQVVELVFNMRANMRLLHMIELFKLMLENEDQVDLARFLEIQTNYRNDLEAHWACVKLCQDMFKPTDFFKDKFVELLADLRRYKYPHLVTQALILLHRYHSSHETLFSRMAKTKMILTADSVFTLKKIETELPALKEIKFAKITPELSAHLSDILHDLSRLCVLEDTREPNRFNQDIIANYDIVTDCMDMITNFVNQFEKEEKLATTMLKLVLRFLKVVSAQNESIQSAVAFHLRGMFYQPLPELEFGELLLDIYRENIYLCLTLPAERVQSVAKFYSKNFHPIWIAFLTAVCSFDSYVLKKNQDFIVKHVLNNEVFMTIVTETSHEQRLNILSAYESDGEEFTIKHRLCTLVGLLATCAQGGYRAAESFGQSILHMDDVLDYLNLDNLCAGLLSPFAQFLTWSYLNSNSETALKDIKQLGNDNRMEGFVWRLADIIEDAEHILAEDRNLGTELLRNRPANIHVSFDDQRHEKKEILSFVCDAAVPFIYALAKLHYGKNITLPHDLVAHLARALSRFAQEAAHCLTRKCQQLLLMNTCQLYSNVSGIQVQIPLLHQNSTNQIKTQAQLTYEDMYREELLVNETFSTLCRNLRTAYEGRNTVRFQIGTGNDGSYTSLDGADTLPLGIDFQNIVNSFLIREGKNHGTNSKNRDKRLYRVPGIILHLKNSIERSRAKTMTQTEQAKLSELDMRVIQIVRGMVYNEFVRISKTQWQKKKSRKQAVTNLMATKEDLFDQGILEAIMPHFGRFDHVALGIQTMILVKELFQGNHWKSRSFRYLMEARQQEQFMSIKIMFEFTTNILKEYANLSQQVIALELETVLLHKATIGFPQYPILLAAVDDKSNRTQEMRRHEIIRAIRADMMNMIRTNGKILYVSTDQANMHYQRHIAFIGSASLLLSMIQALSNNPNARDIMREQPGHAISINVVQVTANLLKTVSRNINRRTVVLMTEAMRTMGELVKGNQRNQSAAYEFKLPDILNLIIQDEKFEHCEALHAAECLSAAAYLIVFLTEESRSEKSLAADGSLATGATIIMTSLDRDAIWSRVCYCYRLGHRSQQNLNDSAVVRLLHSRHHTMEFGELRPEDEARFLDTGFIFFQILKRASDLNLFDPKLHWDDPIWKFFDTGTMSVEYVKDGVLQRFYFRVKDQSTLRKEVEEKMNWEIDRSISGNKYRDYIGWAWDIIDDIQYQRDVNAWLIGHFLVHQWKLLNYVVLFLGTVIQVVMLIFWDKGTDPVPVLAPTHLANINFILTAGLGSVLNIAGAALFFSFFLSNLSGFTSWANRTTQIIRAVVRRDRGVRIPRASKLEVGILSGQTLYYVMFFVMSILGSALSPAFFAFILLQITANNQLLGRVIAAVTQNGRSLLWVTVMGLILIYIHAIVGFLVLRQYFVQSNLFCDTLWQCYLTLLRESLIFTLKRIDNPIVYKTDVDFATYALKFIWDMSFYIIVLTVAMNLIFGIIVDTFRQLRDSKWRIEQEMQTRCFLCERDNYEFEQRGVRFVEHVRKEHNIMSYVFLLVHMEDADPEHLSAAELYIETLLQIEEENFTFFPHKRAISLDGFSTVDRTDESQSTAEMRAVINGIAQLVQEASLKRSRLVAAAARDIQAEKQNSTKTGEPKPIPRPSSISRTRNAEAALTTKTQGEPVTATINTKPENPVTELVEPVQDLIVLEVPADNNPSPKPYTKQRISSTAHRIGHSPSAAEADPLLAPLRDVIYSEDPPVALNGLREAARSSNKSTYNPFEQS